MKLVKSFDMNGVRNGQKWWTLELPKNDPEISLEKKTFLSDASIRDFWSYRRMVIWKEIYKKGAVKILALPKRGRGPHPSRDLFGGFDIMYRGHHKVIVDPQT